jgi:hypothetical protein
MSPICATHPTHLILLDLITQIIFGDECRSLMSVATFANLTPRVLFSVASAGKCYFSVFVVPPPLPVASFYRQHCAVWDADSTVT